MEIDVSVPVRINGEDIDASWFNSLRTILSNFSSIVLSLVGAESLVKTNFSILASQTNTDVTGLVFDSTLTTCAEVDYSIETATKFEKGKFDLVFDGTDWLLYYGDISGDDSGILFEVDASTGQVDYTSDAETATMKYKVNTLDF